MLCLESEALLTYDGLKGFADGKTDTRRVSRFPDEAPFAGSHFLLLMVFEILVYEDKREYYSPPLGGRGSQKFSAAYFSFDFYSLM